MLGCILALAAALGGCVETGGPEAKALDVTGAIAHGEIRSPRAAPVALASLDGLPSPLLQRLQEDLSHAARAREIDIAEPSGARYFLRGYVDTYPSEHGTTIHSVWDLFDASKQRLRRLDDAFDVPVTGDPSSVLDDTALATMAQRSADAIALALSATPEAAGPAPTTAAAAPAAQDPAN